MKRRIRRKAVIIGVLLLLIALLAAWYTNFLATRSLKLNFAQPTGDSILPPEYLYSFSGEGRDHLGYPLGILVDGERVFVCDSEQGRMFIFDVKGKVIKTFDDKTLLTPMYVAKNPKDGNLYITDRRARKMWIYTTSGKLVKEFNPRMPKDELPPKEARIKGVQWNPLTLDFAPDGTMYVLDVYHGHRLLIFGPDGKFKRGVGAFGQVNLATEKPKTFQFPNGIEVHGEEVWIVDSNNRRIQVFDRKGDYLRIIPTSGLPRGIAFLNPMKGEPSAGEKAAQAKAVKNKKGDKSAEEEASQVLEKAVVIDTLSHDATIWNVKGSRLVSFGEKGVLEGQFQYPNAVSVSKDNLVFVTDSGNVRVQVWGWPSEISPIPPIPVPRYWLWCLSPLLLLPLLLLLRKRKFMATDSFIEGMFQAELIDTMPDRRRTWIVTPDSHELFKDREQGDVKLGELLNPFEHSESDATRIEEKLEIPHDLAIILAIAQRAKVFCTEDDDLRRLAKSLEIDVVNREEYLQRFTKRDEKLKEQAS